MVRPPHVLLINPWITDFAAFDLWSRPIGLMLLGSLLREAGCGVSLVDCLERPRTETLPPGCREPGGIKGYGTGKFDKCSIPVPDAVADLPRRYFRYGVPIERIQAALSDSEPPDLVWVTSVMTYWYPGVQETIRSVRKTWPETPIWLGGAYARLCPEHARRTSGADRVVTEPTAALPALIEQATGYQVANPDSWASLGAAPMPAHDLMTGPTYAPLLASKGCPQRCSYCASALLRRGLERRTPKSLYAEILHVHDVYGVQDFAFHDDALIPGAGETLRRTLERLIESDLQVRFHTPNGLHVDALDSDWCRLLFASNFETLRLGLETAHPDRAALWGRKANLDTFQRALGRLSEAGFQVGQIGAYLLVGLPGQGPQDVVDSIEAVRATGALPYLSEYSPIPGTALWEESVRISSHDLVGEPLTHNNTFFACRRPDFGLEDLAGLKRLALAARRRLLAEAG